MLKKIDIIHNKTEQNNKNFILDVFVYTNNSLYIKFKFDSKTFKQNVNEMLLLRQIATDVGLMDNKISLLKKVFYKNSSEEDGVSLDKITKMDDILVLAIEASLIPFIKDLKIGCEWCC